MNLSARAAALLLLLSVLVSSYEISAPGTYDGYVVSQVHLAQGKDSSQMTVMWVTAAVAKSEVRVGLNADDLSSAPVVTGSSSTYTLAPTGYPSYTSGQLHTAYLTNLLPDTVYYYQCGDTSTGDLSGILSFKTMYAKGDKRAFSFGLIGDLGATNDSISTLTHVAMNPDLNMILHAGDLSYANCNEPLWDEYGLMIEDLASARPWMVGPGNHEIEMPKATSSGSELYTAFEARYKMPGDKPGFFYTHTYTRTQRHTYTHVGHEYLCLLTLEKHADLHSHTHTHSHTHSHTHAHTHTHTQSRVWCHYLHALLFVHALLVPIRIQLWRLLL